MYVLFGCPHKHIFVYFDRHIFSQTPPQQKRERKAEVTPGT